MPKTAVRIQMNSSLPDTMVTEEKHIFMQIWFENQTKHLNSNGVLFPGRRPSLEPGY